jgi:hypothetical protein
MSGGLGSGKGSSSRRGRGGRKGSPILRVVSVSPDEWDEALEDSAVEGKIDFTHDRPLQGYDSKRVAQMLPQ